jgi:pimeloyl-ACP methyl ester carboxylesterase
MRHHSCRRWLSAVVLGAVALGLSLTASTTSLDREDGVDLMSIDHYVRVKSTVPAIAGQSAHVYVRERVSSGAALRGSSFTDRVVLFVHGAGTPAEVAFDVPYQDFSWMAFLARAGFDVFSMDTTGYGRSTRPHPMDDPCNLTAAQQAQFVPSLIERPCAPSYPHELSTIASDWDDINAVVDYVRARRHVEKVSLVAWSLGGPRSGGFTAHHPEKVSRLVLLAPAYNPESAGVAPATLPRDGVPMNTQSRDEFIANWDRQVGCADQYTVPTRDAVWSALLDSDPVGATWGSGVRRAPQTTSWGWNKDVVAKTQTPVLMIAGALDKQVPPDRVRQLHQDIASPQKVLVDLACSSHNAMWEKNHGLMFAASLEWLTKGTVNNLSQGVVRLGY